MKASLVFLFVALLSLAAAEEFYTVCYYEDSDDVDLYLLDTRDQSLDRVQYLGDFDDIDFPYGIAVTKEGDLAVVTEHDDNYITIRLFPATEDSSSSSSSSSSDDSIPFDITDFEDYNFIVSGGYGLAAIPEGLIAAEDDNGDAAVIHFKNGEPEYAEIPAFDIEYAPGYAYNPADGRLYLINGEGDFGFSAVDYQNGRLYPLIKVDTSSFGTELSASYSDYIDGLEFSRDGSRAYVWDYENPTTATLSVFDAEDDFRPLSQVEITYPVGVAYCDSLSPLRFNSASDALEGSTRSERSGKSQSGSARSRSKSGSGRSGQSFNSGKAGKAGKSNRRFGSSSSSN